MDPSAGVEFLAKIRSTGTVSGGGSRFYSATSSFPFTRSYSCGTEQVVVDNTSGDFQTPNAFQVVRVKCSGSQMNGSYYESPSSGVHHSNTPTLLYNQNKAALQNDVTVPPGLEAKLYANASPDRADILLPVFFWELADLPYLIYYLGRRFFEPKYNKSKGLKVVPSDWLTYNFGIAPLVADVQKMISFADAMHRREKEFKDLYSEGGLRRKVKLFEGSGPMRSIVISILPHNLGLPGNIPINGQERVRVWGTCRYSPALLPDGSPLIAPTPNDIRRKVLGLNAANITLNIWEALPWSWLIDYFGNVSSYLGANQLGRTAVASRACIMTHRSIEYTHGSVQGQTGPAGGSISLSAGSVLIERKSRTVVNPPSLPTFPIPALSGHQLSILGSLAVLRRRKLDNGVRL